MEPTHYPQTISQNTLFLLLCCGDTDQHEQTWKLPSKLELCNGPRLHFFLKLIQLCEPDSSWEGRQELCWMSPQATEDCNHTSMCLLEQGSTEIPAFGRRLLIPTNCETSPAQWSLPYSPTKTAATKCFLLTLCATTDWEKRWNSVLWVKICSVSPKLSAL